MIHDASYAAVCNLEAGGTHQRQQPLFPASLFISLVHTYLQRTQGHFDGRSSGLVPSHYLQRPCPHLAHSRHLISVGYTQ